MRTSNRRRRNRLRLLFRFLGAALLVLAAVLVVNTLRFTAEPVAVAPVRDIGVDEAGAAARLGEAIRLATVSDHDPARIDTSAFVALHALLERAFPRVHAALRREVVSGLSLLYTWPGRDPARAPVLLMGHLDVVPVDSGAAWTHPPFGGVVDGGYVWGRGAIDDKNGVLGILEAVEQLLADGFEPAATVYLAFGHDEEVGGQRGARALAALVAERTPRLALVLDEGGAVMDGIVPGLAAPVALVGVAEKGYVSLELSAETTGGHSSRPPAETAIGLVARAVARLEADPFPARLDGATAAMFDRLGPHMPFGQRLAFANRWLLDPVLLRVLTADPSTAATVRTTTAPTLFDAGFKDNVLPARAAAVVNFRILPGETAAGVQERVAAVVDDARIRIRVLNPETNVVEPSPVSRTDSEAFALLERSIREVYEGGDLLVAPYLVVGGTDAKHFAGLSDNVYRFAATTMRPDDLTRFHGADERIAVADYARMIRLYYQLLRNADTLP